MSSRAILIALIVFVVGLLAGSADAVTGDVNVPLEGSYNIGGFPVLRGGPTGFTPTIGADDHGSVSVRVAMGETINLYIGGKMVGFVEMLPSGANFRVFGAVSAAEFIQEPLPASGMPANPWP